MEKPDISRMKEKIKTGATEVAGRVKESADGIVKTVQERAIKISETPKKKEIVVKKEKAIMRIQNKLIDKENVEFMRV